jgi:heme/copper-type cytochrome/quinol oxidase subunit 2
MRLLRVAIVAVTALLLSAVYFAAAHFAASEAVGPLDQSYRLNIGEGKTDAKILHARQGDRVTFIVTSTRAGQFYIHGPEVQSTLLPGIETTLTLTAKYSGRYYVHFHQINCTDPDESHLELAVLDVMPN